MTDIYKLAEQLRRAIQLFTSTLPEEKALEIPGVYPEWSPQTVYDVGDIFSYGVNSIGDPQLYKVVQAHTSQADWLPNAVPSLYVAFGLNDAGYPVWAQPTGAHDAYNLGDIVDYNGKLYKSVIDGNVWSPDVYPAGWDIFEESTTDPTPEPTPEEPTPEPEPEPTPEPTPEEPEETYYPEFVQPTGSHDAYNIGDRVTYNGHIYESTINANVWSPDTYPAGWTLIE